MTVLLISMAVAAVCGVVRQWIKQVQATRRVSIAVAGTESCDRAAVVRACAQLESAQRERTVTGSVE
jgi:hypothetical protein